VNKSQSSNDVFPTAMHIAAVEGIRNKLQPSLMKLKATLAAKAFEFKDIVKIGRHAFAGRDAAHAGSGVLRVRGAAGTGRPASSRHLAAPVRAGAGRHGRRHRSQRARRLRRKVAAELARLTGLPFVTAPNKFEVMAAADALVNAHGALKTLAASMMKIANDVRWLASGPRRGIGELSIPPRTNRARRSCPAR